MLITLKVFAKWREKRQPATLFLLVSMAAWIGACWSAMGIYLLAEAATDVAIVLQKTVYSCVLGGGVAMFLFGEKVFFQFKKPLFKYMYVAAGGIIILCIALLPSVDMQYFPSYGTYPLLSINIAFSIILVIYLVPVLLGISVLAVKASKKIEDRLYQVGYRFIAIGNILIFGTFVIDALSTASQGVDVVYAVFLNFTWIVPIIAALFSYIGWTLPEWFRAIVVKNDSSGNP